MYIVQDTEFISKRKSSIWILKKQIPFTILQALLLFYDEKVTTQIWAEEKGKKELISNTQLMKSFRMMMAQNTERQGRKLKKRDEMHLWRVDKL